MAKSATTCTSTASRPCPPPETHQNLQPQHHQRRLRDLETPAFIVNRRAFRRNCEIVRTSARTNGISRLRLHVKTHKTPEGCLIQAGYYGCGGDGCDDVAAPDLDEDSSKVVGFVASTLPEVEMLVELARRHPDGPFRDVLYGVPICGARLEAVRNLQRRLPKGDECVIHLMVDHPGQVRQVEDFARSASGTVATDDATTKEEQWSVFLKLDTGYHRAGITCDERGVDLASEIIDSPFLKLQGVYSHCGHAYDINDDATMIETTQSDLKSVSDFLKLLSDRLSSSRKDFDVSSLHTSVGSTPSLFQHSNPLKIPNLELHPGNYVFYDRQQLWTGACAGERSVAGFVLARVIGHYEDEARNSIMLDAGATALTKETTAQGGVCAILGRSDLECYRMSQEVTMVRRCRDDGSSLLSGKFHAFPFEEFPLGSMVVLVPNHSCLAAACFDKYHVIDEERSGIDSDTFVVDEWNPVKGW